MLFSLHSRRSLSLSLHTLIVHQSLSSLVYLIHHLHSPNQVIATCPIGSYCTGNVAGNAVTCPTGKTSIANQSLITACTPASPYFGYAGEGDATACKMHAYLLLYHHVFYLIDIRIVTSVSQSEVYLFQK